MSTITEKVLFVGGCADGQWLDRPVGEYFKVPRRYPIAGGNAESVINCDLYRCERLRSGKREWECWVLDSLSSEDFIDWLIDGYA